MVSQPSVVAFVVCSSATFNERLAVTQISRPLFGGCLFEGSLVYQGPPVRLKSHLRVESKQHKSNSQAEGQQLQAASVFQPFRHWRELSQIKVSPRFTVAWQLLARSFSPFFLLILLRQRPLQTVFSLSSCPQRLLSPLVFH